MASACINNIGVSPKYSSYAWLSPRISFSREDSNSKLKSSDLTDSADFEFRLHDCPQAMLPADELFSDGKLIPLHLSVNVNPSTTTKPVLPEIKAEKCISRTDPYLFSPKAPRCASRWREILGLKKQSQGHSESTSTNSKSLKLLLNRSLKSSSSSTTTPLDTSLSLPLLKDSDSESVSISSSRLSLSSSSSSHDHEDLPRLSLEFEKLSNPNPFTRTPNPNQNQHRMRQINTNSTTTTTSSTNPGRVGRNPIKRQSTGTESATVVNSSRGASVDSPRMNSSGKVVFQSLERSSSSPSTLNGGPRFKHRGMERSYSANVRVTPVLNVPVSSLRGASKPGSVFGFGQLFSSPHTRDGNGGGSKTNRSSNRIRVTDRN